RDPADTYGRMDFLSRDQLRQAVEQLAATGEGQVRVAHKAVETARQAAADAEASGLRDLQISTHVGYHLVGEGRRALEADLGFRPPIADRLRRVLTQRATPLYLGALGLTTGAFIAGAVAYAVRHDVSVGG